LCAALTAAKPTLMLEEQDYYLSSWKAGICDSMKTLLPNQLEAGVGWGV